MLEAPEAGLTLSKDGTMPKADSVHSTPKEPAPEFDNLAAAVSPLWHAAILKLASATERVARQFEIRNDAKWVDEDGAFVREARRLADDLIRFSNPKYQ